MQVELFLVSAKLQLEMRLSKVMLMIRQKGVDNCYIVRGKFLMNIHIALLIYQFLEC